MEHYRLLYLHISFRIKSFEFTEKGVYFELPKILTLSDCSIRGLFTTFDHISQRSVSYYPQLKRKAPGTRKHIYMRVRNTISNTVPKKTTPIVHYSGKQAVIKANLVWCGVECCTWRMKEMRIGGRYKFRRLVTDLSTVHSLISVNLLGSLFPYLNHIPPTNTRGRNLKVQMPALHYSRFSQNIVSRVA